MTKVLIVPGIGNSGPEHWQSLWQHDREDFVRVEQRDWDHPVCSQWLLSLDRAAGDAGPDFVIVAHSLGTLLVVHWLARTSIAVRGALLVAVPDPGARSFPTEAEGFAPVPMGQLPCPSMVVASSNDPYSELPFAQACADSWGSRLVNIGAAGHINATSGLGAWQEGQRLLREFSAARTSSVR